MALGYLIQCLFDGGVEVWARTKRGGLVNMRSSSTLIYNVSALESVKASGKQVAGQYGNTLYQLKHDGVVEPGLFVRVSRDTADDNQQVRLGQWEKSVAGFVQFTAAEDEVVLCGFKIGVVQQ